MELLPYSTRESSPACGESPASYAARGAVLSVGTDGRSLCPPFCLLAIAPRVVLARISAHDAMLLSFEKMLHSARSERPASLETLKIMAMDGESKWNFSPPVVTHGISESWHDLTARNFRVRPLTSEHVDKICSMAQLCVRCDDFLALSQPSFYSGPADYDNCTWNGQEWVRVSAQMD